MKNPKRVKAGKKSNTQGKLFEKRVRLDLEQKGYIVDKWTNNVDLDHGYLKASQPRYNFFTKTLMMNTAGFPDFIRFRAGVYGQDIEAVESKINGQLSKVEIEKCRWYLNKMIFSKIYIAEKTKQKNRIKIVYHDFDIKYEK